MLITDSEDIADKVQESLKYRVPRTEHAERINTSLRGRQSGIILTDGIEQSIDAANAYAAEHLEVQTADPDAVIAKIRNAGAIFRGPYSRFRWATTCPVPTTCCRPPAPRASPPASACTPS